MARGGGGTVKGALLLGTWPCCCCCSAAAYACLRVLRARARVVRLRGLMLLLQGRAEASQMRLSAAPDHGLDALPVGCVQVWPWLPTSMRAPQRACVQAEMQLSGVCV